MPKEAYFVLCTLYKDYLEKRESGQSKGEAVIFKEPTIIGPVLFPNMLIDDLEEALETLTNYGMIETYISLAGHLTDKGITVMENRFKNNLKAVTDFILKLIPLIP